MRAQTHETIKTLVQSRSKGTINKSKYGVNGNIYFNKSCPENVLLILGKKKKLPSPGKNYVWLQAFCHVQGKFDEPVELILYYINDN